MRHTATMFARGETTCFKVVDQFAESVIDVFYNAIKLPDAEQCEAFAQHLYRERGMPGCIGAMDGKHFHITAGGGDDVSFKCYKGYHQFRMAFMSVTICPLSSIRNGRCVLLMMLPFEIELFCLNVSYNLSIVMKPFEQARP